jgi:hypothetical protein
MIILKQSLEKQQIFINNLLIFFNICKVLNYLVHSLLEIFFLLKLAQIFKYLIYGLITLLPNWRLQKYKYFLTENFNYFLICSYNIGMVLVLIFFSNDGAVLVNR